MKIRLTSELKQSIEEAAKASSRTLNSEIVKRLQASFESIPALPFPVQAAIDEELRERGGTKEEALTRIALAAQAHGGTIFHAQFTSKTKFEEILAMLEAGKKVIPANSTILFEITPED